MYSTMTFTTPTRLSRSSAGTIWACQLPSTNIQPCTTAGFGARPSRRVPRATGHQATVQDCSKDIAGQHVSQTEVVHLEAPCSTNSNSSSSGGMGIDDSSNPVTNLLVHTMAGNALQLPICTQMTTVGDIRAAVASMTQSTANQVRLAYNGQELLPLHDSQTFKLCSGSTAMLAMPRMRAGSGSNPHTAAAGVSHTADRNNAANATRRRKRKSRQNSNAATATPDASEHLELLASSETSSSSGGGEAGSGSSVSISAPESTRAIDHQGSHSSSNSSRSAHRSPMSAAVAASPANGFVPMPSAVAWPNTVVGPAGFEREFELAKELRQLEQEPLHGVSAAPADDNLLTWHVKLAGPIDTPYYGGLFDIELWFAGCLPASSPPMAVFKTPIWHPNISYESGHVSADFGGRLRSSTRGSSTSRRQAPTSASKACSVRAALQGLQELLSHPNLKFGVLNKEAAEEYRHCYETYWWSAMEMTEHYAMGDNDTVDGYSDDN
eukprot:GHRR01001034.1.p1 GENE.GHRR01001034.1~~GHRR01001034.1.p1  ORF type:complete len:495 (+),score=178.27 GHRR01001034.1:1769-3253(+)